MARHGLKIAALAALAAAVATAPAMAGGYERDGTEWSVERGGYEAGSYGAERYDDGYATERYEGGYERESGGGYAGGYEREYRDDYQGGGAYREHHRRGPPPCELRRDRYDDDGCGQVRLSNDFFGDTGGVGPAYFEGGGGGGGYVVGGGSAGAGASAFAFASASASARVSVSFHGGFRFHGGGGHRMGHGGCGCGGKH